MTDGDGLGEGLGDGLGDGDTVGSAVGDVEGASEGGANGATLKTAAPAIATTRTATAMKSPRAIAREDGAGTARRGCAA